MTWYQTFNDAFFLTLAGVIFGFGGMVVQSVVKSRCKECSICWGMFRCQRSVEVDLDEIDHGITNTPSTLPSAPPRVNNI